MFISRVFNVRLLALLALSFVFASAGFGFAAGNTVPTKNAGDGSATISGYSVGTPSYALDNTNPGNIDSVTFTLTPSGGGGKPTTVKTKLVSSGSTWYTCTSASTASPYSYTCATTSPQATVSTADELRVVAAE